MAEKQQRTIYLRLLDDIISFNGGRVDKDGFLHFTKDGKDLSEEICKPIFIGVPGSGSGSSENNATLKVSNTTGWLFTSIASGNSCVLKFNWSSEDEGLSTGVGTLQVYCSNSLKSTKSINQGDIEVDVSEWLTSGSNSIKLVITDMYGNSKSLNFSIEVVTLSVSSNFDGNTVYSGAISYYYTPLGAVTKTVYFVLDGELLGTSVVSLSGQQQDFQIPAQSHGNHTFEVYMTADIGEVPVESNHLYYDLICTEDGNMTPIIASAYQPTAVEQYDTFSIPYRVYNPANLMSNIVLSVNGETAQELTVDRTEHEWSYRSDVVQDLELSISCGTAKKTFTIPVIESSVQVTAVTNNLVLDLSSYGRSNLEANPLTWESNGVSAEFSGFNLASDGWCLDEDKVTVMRVGGDSRIKIPLKLFEKDLRVTGKTIELEFSTRSVLNYNATIISCMNAGRGLEVTSQQAFAASAQSSIGTQYKEEEHIRLSFVIEKRTSSKMMLCYLNGICSGSVVYPDDDDFTQNNAVEISIGSSECTVDLYHIRVYDNDLTRHQMLTNWIADTQNGALRRERWLRNDVYDAYGNIVIEKLPKNLPYLVLECTVLPQFKGDKKTVSGYYIDPAHPERNFRFVNAEIDVQGTSSQYYKRKNYKIKFKNGFILSDGTLVSTYGMNDDAIPVMEFTFKADVASSEGANNVVLAQIFNDLCPVKTPAQYADPRVRQTIDGHPIVVFWDNGSSPVFLAKYNFNNDKGTPEVFGFRDGDESWEIKQNGTDPVGFKSTECFNDDSWEQEFEARYPEDNKNTQRLKSFIDWVASTNIETATGELLTESVTYANVVYTNDTPEYRLAKFVNELPLWASVEHSVYYYLMTLLFLCIDQREKNAFPTYIASMNLWIWLFYDADSSLGINNKGALAFSPFLEDIDFTEAGDPVFNGQANVFWTNIRLGFADKIQEMYQNFRVKGLLSYEIVKARFDNHQSKWPEAIFNEDGYNKCLEPWINDKDSTYLSMNLGKKELQRDWWLFFRFRYIDSKFIIGSSMEKRILIRAHSKASIWLKSYVKIYGNVFYNSLRVSKRMLDTSIAYEFPWDATGAEDAVIGINDADLITSLGDLSPLMVETIDLSGATHLTYLKLGDASSDYVNQNLTSLTLGNNTLLKTIDVRNCISLSQSVDASGCTNVEEVYFDGTSITGLSLPNGGALKKLHLPSTVVNLTLRNQTSLEEFVMPSYSQVTTLVLENVSPVIDPLEILGQMSEKSRVRIIGFDLSVESVDEIRAFYDSLDTMHGLDENGYNVNKPQISGTIHIDSILGSELAELQSRYADITIAYQHIASKLYFYNSDGSNLLYTAEVQDGGDGMYVGSEPTKESTAQHDYDFAGWSKTPGGSVENDAIAKVTADRSVYAVFTETVRTYSVYFYNGSTLLQTVSKVPYGGSATYTGTTPVSPDGSAEDYPFIGWSPTPTNITGTTKCYAQFSSPVQVTEITDDWQTIFASIDDGTYKEKYKVGNYKSIDLGSEGIIDMQIAAFDTDLLADGSGTAKVSWVARQLLVSVQKMMNKTYSAVMKVVEGAPAWGLEYSTNTEKSWTSKNGGIKNNSAEATWTVTAKEDLSITVYYRTSSSTLSYNMMTLIVDGETLLDESTTNSNQRPSKTISIAAGNTCTIYAKHTCLIASTFSATISISTTGSYTNGTCVITEEIGTTSSRVVDYYELGMGAIGGWEYSDLRSYLEATIKPLIPTEVASRIVSVTKVHKARDAQGVSYDQTTSDELFVPSNQEVQSGLYEKLFEEIGRKKSVYGKTIAGTYVFRDAYSISAFYGQSGNSTSTNQTMDATKSQNPCLCFCTG